MIDLDGVQRWRLWGSIGHSHFEAGCAIHSPWLTFYEGKAKRYFPENRMLSAIEMGRNDVIRAIVGRLPGFFSAA